MEEKITKLFLRKEEAEEISRRIKGLNISGISNIKVSKSLETSYSMKLDALWEDLYTVSFFYVPSNNKLKNCEFKIMNDSQIWNDSDSKGISILIDEVFFTDSKIDSFEDIIKYVSDKNFLETSTQFVFDVIGNEENNQKEEGEKMNKPNYKRTDFELTREEKRTDFKAAYYESNIGRKRTDCSEEERKTKFRSVGTFYKCWAKEILERVEGNFEEIKNLSHTVLTYEEIKDLSFRPIYVNGKPYFKEQTGVLIPVAYCVAFNYKQGDKFKLLPIPSGKRPSIKFEDIPEKFKEKVAKQKKEYYETMGNE